MASMLRLPFSFPSHPLLPVRSFSTHCSIEYNPQPRSDHSTSRSDGNSSNVEFIHNSVGRLPSDWLHHPAGSSTSPLFWTSDDEAEASISTASMRVANPGLHFANIMWFNKPVNAQITVGPDESPDSIVRRFRRVVSQAGVIQECRRRRFFENPQDKVKRKRQALRRRKTRFRGPGFGTDAFAAKDTSTPASNDDDDDDNWDYEPNL